MIVPKVPDTPGVYIAWLECEIFCAVFAAKRFVGSVMDNVCPVGFWSESMTVTTTLWSDRVFLLWYISSISKMWQWLPLLYVSYWGLFPQMYWKWWLHAGRALWDDHVWVELLTGGICLRSSMRHVDCSESMRDWTCFWLWRCSWGKSLMWRDLECLPISRSTCRSLSICASRKSALGPFS